MDPLAHTLLGATLAESGLKRCSRYATATLIIGANLPDIDALANFWGADVALHARRGSTHGVLAMVALPLMLAAAVWSWHRWRGSKVPAAADAPPFRPRAIAALAFLGVLSHPPLDWLNTYGVRLLMPFDRRWFYGDTLFIVDPWFWLLAAAGVVLARSGSARAVAGWLVLAALATWLVITTDVVGPGVKGGWILGIAAIAAIRWRLPANATETFARATLATLALYVGLAFGFARLAESALAAQTIGPGEIQANPAPGVPWAHRVVIVEPGTYRIVTREGTVFVLPRREPDAIVKAALAQESVRGFAIWMRYPYWTVEERPDRWIVRFQDLRYQGPDIPNPRGIGFAQVEVPKR